MPERLVRFDAETGTITGLDPDTEYEIQVLAVTDGAGSDYSTSVEVRTLVGDATVPTGLMATTIGLVTINLSWDAVDGASSYLVRYRDADDSSLPVLTAAATTTEVSLILLTPGRTYSIEVASVIGVCWVSSRTRL